MDADSFIQQFAPRLRSGDAAVLSGAGVSVPSRLPDWAALLEPARAELHLPKTFTDLSLLASYYVSEVPGGRVRLTRAIQERLTGETFAPNPIHHALWRLPIRYMWSLNFDNLLEEAHRMDFGHFPRVIDTDKDMRGSLSAAGCTLVKMHGGIGDLEGDGRRLVVTRDDFDLYIREFPRTWARLLADFYTKSILFVGISFADPNMQTLLRLVRTGSDHETQRHYSIVEEISPVLSAESTALNSLQRADLERGGVQSVELPSFSDLPSLLNRLAVAARPPAVMLSGSLVNHSAHAETLLRALGTNLAGLHPQISLIHGGSDSISSVPHRFAEQLERDGRYSGDRLVQVRRSEPKETGTQATVVERRLGSINFPGADAADVRRDLCRRARVCVVIGGREHTMAEVDECRTQGVPVIPVPIGHTQSGEPLGYSQRLWEEMIRSGDALGERLKRFETDDPIVLSGLVLQEVQAHLQETP